MAKKKKQVKEIVYAPVVYQPITETIEKNYMPYVMSVIISRERDRVARDPGD